MESLPTSTSKSSGRMADKFRLRTWSLDPRMWTLRFSYLVFTTTCMDEEASLRKAAFSFTRMLLVLMVFHVLYLELNSCCLLECVFGS